MNSEIVDYISNIIINNIQPNLLQIINSEFVKYINTGDRIKDSACVLIVNSILLIFIKIIYKCASYIYLKLNSYNTPINEIDTEQICKNISLDTILKYKYKLEIPVIQLFLNWVNLKNIKLNTSQTTLCTTTFQIYDALGNITLNHYNENKPLVEVSVGGIKNYFTPIYKYIINNNTEYIFMVGTCLFSNDLHELDKLYKLFVTDSDNNNNKCIKETHQTNSIYELNYDKYTLSSLGVVNSNIIFDTIYFDDKPYILEWINKFQNNTMYPKGLSLVNKLGILLYGPPGTGKTGFICALANYLNRNILMINALNITNNEQSKLKDIINKCKNTHIIVFDEFDYILKSCIPVSNEYDKYSELLTQTTDITEKKNIYQLMQKCKNELNDTNLDNRFILNLLDGIGNDDNRIIIATTNNPENINSAFLRPGRFDIVQKLGFCSFSMFKNIVLTKYDTYTEEFFETKKVEIHNILSLNITPLVLINNLVTSNSIDELFNLLKKLKQQNYNKIVE